jgi:membrane fusion protein (multidrug efflux system)
MFKKFINAFIALAIIFGGIYLVKAKQFEPPPPFAFPPETVTSAKAELQNWEQKLSAVANIRAVQGVQVSTEIPGILTHIHFKSGQYVEKGAPLIELDTSTEKAELESALARAELADINLNRAKELRQKNTIAQSELDAAVAEAKAARSNVEALEAIISKKQIKAPFTGKLGIRLVNIGEYLNPGTPIVSLQNLDNVYVNFNLSQKDLSKVKKGQLLRVYSDAWPDEVFTGKLSVIEPAIESKTRSLQLLGTIPNPDEKLRPGMFVNVEILDDQKREVLALPATSVYYRSYGDVIFVIKDSDKTKDQKVVEERFIKTGETLGDYVEITKGVEAGDEVVTSGVFKLSNGRPVRVDNDKSLAFSTHPTPEEN